jgi:hypothetical protein
MARCYNPRIIIPSAAGGRTMGALITPHCGHRHNDKSAEKSKQHKIKSEESRRRRRDTSVLDRPHKCESRGSPRFCNLLCGAFSTTSPPSLS